MLGAPETRVRMEEDRISTKMEEAAIRTLEHWTDLQVGEQSKAPGSKVQQDKQTSWMQLAGTRWPSSRAGQCGSLGGFLKESFKF